jgi:3-dehydroquinate dehydratase/shikimate dehydrogenase
MAKICLCLTGKTLAEDLKLLEQNRRYIDVAELRVDCLDPGEWLSIRRFPRLAGLPVVLAIRRDIDGGYYSEAESARIVLLSQGLAFSEPDTRRNFAYVDLEEDLDVPSLEEAARAFGTRIIRSYHNVDIMDGDLSRKLRSLYRVGDEIAKIAVKTAHIDEVTRLFKTAREFSGQEKIIIGMGDGAVCTRILAQKLGSYLCYTSVRDVGGIHSAAPGQLAPQELAEFYRFRDIKRDTPVFGVTGYPLMATSSPAFFNEVFKRENINAVYIPFPANTIEGFLSLAGEIGLKGASVTVPHKEALLPFLDEKSGAVASIGACNTIIKTERGWSGFNTDASGFSDSLLAFLGKKTLKGLKITIIGAGGVACAVAHETARLGGKAIILNRTMSRAEALAERYKFEWGGLDEAGVHRVTKKYHDVIIQTTSAGMEPDRENDPLALYRFRGAEAVMDLIYKPEKTLFLQRAEKAGCKIQNGFDMLRRQAEYQFGLFFGYDYPA